MSSVVNTKSKSGPPVIGGDKTGANIRKISSSGRSVKQDGRAGSLLYLTLTNKKWSIRVPLLHYHIGSRCPCLIGKSRQSDSHCYRARFERATKKEGLAPSLPFLSLLSTRKMKYDRSAPVMDGTFALKEISLAPYQSLVQKLCDEIDVELTHVNRFTNRHADSLATLASKIKFEDDEDEAVIKISNRRNQPYKMKAVNSYTTSPADADYDSDFNKPNFATSD
ncbi:hypothetical protein V6N12_076154 [Hibiscus sabdariffa]|uniref:RNase H type-1 domain-containing protein n=1 Tax=Hibiscus sabdariffa TaxID=183260 RepID=A0ABR2AW70_9ROSI